MIRYATFARRLWAFVLALVIDLLVFATIAMWTGRAAAAAPFLFWYLLHHVGLVVEGGTLGHRLAGLRVVRVDGERVGVAHAFAREFARIGLSLPPLGLGVLWMLDEPRRRTWHDLLAGTVVVRESLAQAVAPEWAHDPPWRQRSAGQGAATRD